MIARLSQCTGESVFLEMSTYLVVCCLYDDICYVQLVSFIIMYNALKVSLKSISSNSLHAKISGVTQLLIEYDSCNDYCCCTVSLLECAS